MVLLYLKATPQPSDTLDELFLNDDENSYFVVGNTKEIIFPLLVKPENDTGRKWGNYYWAGTQGSNMARYEVPRSTNGCGSWTRMHAARDLYTKPKTQVISICKGKVLRKAFFYNGTDQVTVLHETNDGRKFIVRYGELDRESINVQAGDSVVQGQPLGVTGYLVKSNGTPVLTLGGEVVYMLHFELYTGDQGFDLSSALSNCERPFARRSDLIDPLEILREGYENTFETLNEPERRLFTEEDGRQAIIKLYNRYKNNTWQ